MPNTILNIDGVDLYSHLRVAPGEGFDPADTDFLEPQFGDSTVGVGDPLLGVSEHNREMVIPVHLRSYSTALTNGITNPSFEVDTTGWAISTGGTATLTTGARQTAWSSKGQSSLRFTGSVGAAGSTNFVNASCPATGTLAAAPAEVWTAIVDFNVLTTPTADLRIFINWFTAASGFISAAASPLITQTGEQRILLRGTAPALTAFTSLTVQIGNVIGSADCYIDNVTLVKSSSHSKQFDGSDLNAEWSGTPHNSTSLTLTGKSGLHETIASLNRTLQSAETLVWRDDAADEFTFFNVQFARFEPEYNYRRGQSLWLSGVVRVFTKPYGTTGTYAGSDNTTGSGIWLANPLGSKAGDLPALLRTTWANTVAQAGFAPGQLHGIAVVPSGYKYDVPIASISNRHASAPIIVPNSASYVMGTSIIHVGVPDVLFALQRMKLGRVHLSPASMYEGRNRIFALVAAGGEVYVNSYDLTGEKLTRAVATGPGVFASAVYGFQAIDLGVLNVDSTYPQATTGFDIELEFSFVGLDTSHNIGVNPVEWALNNDVSFGLNRVLVFPEDKTMVVSDYLRRQLAFDDALGSMLPSGGIPAIDKMGNTYSIPVSVGAGVGLNTISNRRFQFSPAFGSGGQVGALVVNHPTVADLQADIELDWWLGAPPASGAAWSIGKYAGANNQDRLFAARLHWTTASGPVFNVITNSLSAPSVLASKSVPSNLDPDNAVLSVAHKGNEIQGMLRDRNTGSIVATISASHAGARSLGQLMFGYQGTGAGSPAICPGFGGFAAIEVPSSSPVNIVEFNSKDQYVAGYTSGGSLPVANLTSRAKGNFPVVDAYDTVVGFSLAADYASTNRAATLFTEYREQFTYVR